METARPWARVPSLGSMGDAVPSGPECFARKRVLEISGTSVTAVLLFELLPRNPVVFRGHGREAAWNNDTDPRPRG